MGDPNPARGSRTRDPDECEGCGALPGGEHAHGCQVYAELAARNARAERIAIARATDPVGAVIDRIADVITNHQRPNGARFVVAEPEVIRELAARLYDEVWEWDPLRGDAPEDP